MIISFVRRDIALKGTFYTWLLLSLFVGIILAGAGKNIVIDAGIPSLAFPSTGQSFTYTFIISWCMLSLFLGPAEVPNHCNRLTLSLPVPAKTLWLSRFLALTIAETALFFVTGLVIVLVNLITGSSPLLPTSIAIFLIQQYSCVLLLIAVVQSLYRKRFAMPSVFSSYAILFLVWLASGALFYKLAQHPIHYALYPFAAALILFLITLSRLPASFTAEPQTYQKARSYGKRQHIKIPVILSRAKTQWIVWITLFRTLYNPWFTPLAFLGLGVLAMGNMDYGLRGKNPLTLAIGIWMFPLLLQFFAVQQLHKLDHLPISRRVIYACQVLPSIGIIFIMAIAGIIAAKDSVNSYSLLGPWMRILPLNLVYILLPWFIMQSFVFAAPRAPGLRVRLSILTASCGLGYMVAVIFRFPEYFSWKIPSLFTFTIRDIAQKIPIETPILWILAFVILVSGYFITERLFKTAQLTHLQKNK